MESYGNTEHMRVRDFPHFLRVSLRGRTRKELFSRATRRVRTVKREYKTSKNIFNALYGRKGEILQLLSEQPRPARELIETSSLGSSTVYHFLNGLRKQGIVTKAGVAYTLGKCSFDSLSLNEIVRIEEEPSLRRRYGISMRELELAFFLWDTFKGLSPQGGYGQTYHSEYTLADAVHRWKTGRTDIPVWALNSLEQLSESDILQEEGSVVQYHFPPGVPVNPIYEGEYKLPLAVDSTLDKILIQLLQKMSKNHLYTFPKKKRWLFETLHETFGDFDDSTSRIPSAITEILKHYYRVTLDRSSACIPPRMKARWSRLTPLNRIAEESSLLLHIISLSSQSNGGVEITSLSKSFLDDVSNLVSDLGLGFLTVHKKHQRPHFRVYLSGSKVAALRRYAHLLDEYPDLETWLQIPLNEIAEKLVLADAGSMEAVCREELTRFVESILKFLERRKLPRKVNYVQWKEEITDFFWEEKLLPSPRKIEELVENLEREEEDLLYA